MTHPTARLAGALLAVLVVLGTTVLGTTGAQAGESFADVLRYLFVTAADSTAVTVIDTESDTVVGALDLGLAAQQLEGSGELAKLVAIDGRSPRIAIVELTSGRVRSLSLDFIPRRLLVGGLRAAAVDPASGTVAFIDLILDRETARTGGLKALRDLMFDADGERLYVAAEGHEGVQVIKAADGRLMGEIAAVPAGLGGVATLSRSPNGRVGFATVAGAGKVGVLGLDTAVATDPIEVGPGAVRAFPSGTGARVFIPDDFRQAVTVASAEPFRVTAQLKGLTGMTGVYSGWFDSVAFVPSSTARAVMVVDQERLVRGPDIPLPGVPGRGTVTADGRRLYLPLADASRVAVIDTETRRLVRTIPVPTPPTAVLMARTFGICH